MSLPAPVYCRVSEKTYLIDSELDPLIQEYRNARAGRQTATRVSFLLFSTGASSLFYNIGCALSCCAASFCYRMSGAQQDLIGNEIASKIEQMAAQRLPAEPPENATVIRVEIVDSFV